MCKIDGWRDHRLQVSQIVAGLDEEIAKLQQARALLIGSNGQAVGRRGPYKKRTMSAAARAKIAAAQRARWAKQKAAK
jgi:hypothetical protein